MPHYVIAADVNGREIESEYEDGRAAMRFWREMKATGRMSYSIIFHLRTGDIIAAGLESQAVSDATINTARSIAKSRRASVIVEDYGTGECYRITPAGHRWAAPAGWEMTTDAD
jgi:hypothetical protein